MLHYKTIDERTLGLLKNLMQLTEFAEMRLVGGSALALHIGHRTSVDIDLFGKLSIDEIGLSKAVNSLGEANIIRKSPNISIYIINRIKVDFVNYPFAWLENVVEKDGIRLAGKKDIAAMKLSAITGRGTKKDFIDLFYLLREFTLEEMMGYYKKKFPEASEFLVLKSLNYFGDAESDETPNIFEEITWPEIKIFLKVEITDYLNKY